MIINKPNFYILTGASGGGKSTIIDALTAQGMHCIEESGRRIVKEQVASGGDATPWQDMQKFCDLIVARNIEAFKAVTEAVQPVFFDRGIPECLNYAEKVPEHYQAAVDTYRYNTKVFVTPPWKEIYRTDAERRHSFEDGLKEYETLAETYNTAGYHIVEVPRLPVEDRVAFILAEISSKGIF
jgi:predicted ATPase